MSDIEQTRFAKLLKQYRNRARLKLRELGFSPRTVQNWERSIARPKPEDLHTLIEKLKLNTIDKQAFVYAYAELEPSETSEQPASPTLVPLDQSTHTDWGDLRDTQMVGRRAELSKLKSQVLDHNCRVIGIIGMSGMGKSTLARKLAEELESTFDYVFIRSFDNAPVLSEFLDQCIRFFNDPRDDGSRQQGTLPSRGEELLRILERWLVQFRCLLILDATESILEDQQRPLRYRHGYEDYGKLLETISKQPAGNRSCLVFTSRKKLPLLEPDVRTKKQMFLLDLHGLSPDEGGLEMLEKLGLVSNEGTTFSALRNLVGFCSGNPLLLGMVARRITKHYSGDVHRYLQDNTRLFGRVRAVLQSQFKDLQDDEWHILFWLAIERQPLSRQELAELIFEPGKHIMDILDDLEDHSLLEVIGDDLEDHSLLEVIGFANLRKYDLQDYVREYVLETFVGRILSEIAEDGDIHLLNSHRLLNVHARDDIRTMQESLLLEPIAVRLRQIGENAAEHLLRGLLTTLHIHFHGRDGYAAGNLLNLLLYMGYDVRDYDFSRLCIWYPFLRQNPVRGLNLSAAMLKRPALADIFEPLLAVAFDPSQPTMLAAVTETGIIRIWDTAHHKQLFMLESTGDATISLVYSPDGTLLASGGKDRIVRLWEARMGEYRQILTAAAEHHHSPIRAVSFSADGRLLASRDEDGVVCIWGCDDEAGTTWAFVSQNCEEPSSALEPGHWKNSLHSVAFYPGDTDPSRQRWLACSTDHAVEVWDVDTWQHIRHYTLPTGHVRALAFRPDGMVLAVGSDTGAICIWHVDQPDAPITNLPTPGHLHSLAFSPDGTLLVAGNERGISLWDTHTWQPRSLEENTHIAVSSVAFSADGTRFAGSCTDRNIRCWHTATGRLEANALQAYNRRVRSIALNAANTHLVSGGGDNKVYLWQLEHNTLRQVADVGGHTDRVWSVNISPDGTTVASTSDDTTIRLWDIHEDNLRASAVLHRHTHIVWATAFSPDGTLLVSTSDDTTVRLWDVRARTCIHTFDGHEARVRAVAFSPDGRVSASASNDGTIRAWNIARRTAAYVIRSGAERFRSVVFSPCGRYIASGSSNPPEVCLWDSQNGELLHTFSREHTNTIWCVAFSPDGMWLASSSQDLTIRIWNMATREHSRVLQEHNGWVRSLAFTADSARVISCGEDGRIKIWDLGTGQCLHSIYADTRYAGVTITGVTGLTKEECDIMKLLGAVEEE
jgi:WD40 repeat protein/transcriptional regulator with XRE-family HTH domain